jgi:hypothetical protein
MHSSPSLRPRLAALFALASFACQDASEPADDGNAATLPSENAAKPGDAATPSEGGARASGMTQVGAPSAPKGGSGSGAGGRGTSTPAEQDASAPSQTPSTPDAAQAPDFSCAADSDCKASNSDCGECRCLNLHKDEQPPACNAPKVTCVIEPCRNKRAICGNAKCALKDEGPNTI